MHDKSNNNSKKKYEDVCFVDIPHSDEPMPLGLCNLQDIRMLMERYSTKPKHGLGQNFLINKNIPERIADSCFESEEAFVLEIGPGIGCLTRELAKRYRKVIAVEIDDDLIPLLQYTLSDLDNVELIHGDVMKLDIKKIIEEHSNGLPVCVCANLPYYITTPILMGLLESGADISRITIMIQDEVADRLTSDPGDDEYGAITAVLAYYGVAEKLFDVSHGNFLPAPKVDSAVIGIDIYRDRPTQPIDEATLFKVIKGAFGMRRKTLSNALSAVFPSLKKSDLGDIIEECGFERTVRGERLSVSDFAKIADAIELRSQQ